jgi:hypothetical protein
MVVPQKLIMTAVTPPGWWRKNRFRVNWKHPLGFKWDDRLKMQQTAVEMFIYYFTK